MSRFLYGPKVDIATTSGMLRIRISLRPHWLGVIAAIAADILFASFLYRQWTHIHWAYRALLLWALGSSVPIFLYQLMGEEIIEIDSQKLCIRKGVHGWERKREYRIEDCSNLEWEEPGEGRNSRLKCKAGWRPIKFGDYLAEGDATAILVALQQTLPEVAQKICAYAGGKEHFITLGLSK